MLRDVDDGTQIQLDLNGLTAPGDGDERLGADDDRLGERTLQ